MTFFRRIKVNEWTEKTPAMKTQQVRNGRQETTEEM